MRLKVALPPQGALAKPRDPGLCCLTPLAYQNRILRQGECLRLEYAEGVTEQSPGSRGLASAPWVLGKKAQSRVLGPTRYGTYSCSAPKGRFTARGSNPRSGLQGPFLHESAGSKRLDARSLGRVGFATSPVGLAHLVIWLGARPCVGRRS